MAFPLFFTSKYTMDPGKEAGKDAFIWLVANGVQFSYDSRRTSVASFQVELS
jgi:hypothetical protein